MSTKTVLLLVGQVLFIQGVISYCVREPACACGTSRSNINGLIQIGQSDKNGNFQLPAGFPLPTQPIGISVSADNLVIDGCLTAVGSLPLFGSVLIDGSVPSEGQVESNFAFGDGNVGIANAGPLLASGTLGLGSNYNGGVINLNRPGICSCN